MMVLIMVNDSTIITAFAIQYFYDCRVVVCPLEVREYISCSAYGWGNVFVRNGSLGETEWYLRIWFESSEAQDPPTAVKCIYYTRNAIFYKCHKMDINCSLRSRLMLRYVEWLYQVIPFRSVKIYYFCIRSELIKPNLNLV